MRKYLVGALALLMVLALATFAACGRDDEDDTPPATEAPTVAPTEAPTEAPAPPPTEAPEEPEPYEPEAPEVELINFPAGIAYSMNLDTLFQQNGAGAWGTAIYDLTPYLNNAGEPAIEIVPNPLHLTDDGAQYTAIHLANRERGWDAVDLDTNFINWDIENYAYLVTFRGYIPFGGTAQINGADSPHSGFASVETDGLFTLRHVFHPGEFDLGERGWMRFTAASGPDLIIYDILVERYVPGMLDVVWSLETDAAFQALSVGAWGGSIFSTPFLTAAGGPDFEVVAGPYGNAISIENRGDSWNGFDIIASLFNLDAFTVTVTGRMEPWGSDFQIGSGNGPWTTLTFETNPDDGTFTAVHSIDGNLIEDHGVRGRLRMQGTVDARIIIYSIVVTE